MAKRMLTESQLMDIVEKATREALATLMEGAGWDTMKDAFKGGLNGDMDDFSDDDLKKVIKGKGANYSDYKDNKADYKRDRAASKAANKDFKKAKADYDKGVITNNNMAAAQSKKDDANFRRANSSAETVLSRPGIIGKGQRAAAVAAGKAGRGIHKAAKTASDFVHNTIGLEEGKKKVK